MALLSSRLFSFLGKCDCLSLCLVYSDFALNLALNLVCVFVEVNSFNWRRLQDSELLTVSSLSISVVFSVYKEEIMY